MGPNQVSENNATAVAPDDALPLDDIPAATDESIEAPTEVRQGVASMPATGVHFNFAPFEQIAALAQAGRMDDARSVYNQLDDQQRYVYNNIRNMERVPANEAARLADEFRKMQDAASTPQAEAAKLRVDTTKQESAEGAKKTYQRASNMLFLLDNLRGGNRETAKKGEEAWRPRVGRIQGGMHNPGGWMPQILTSAEDMGWVADFNSLKGIINLQEAQRNAGQGSLSDGERLLMAQSASLGLERQRDEPGFGQAFERMYDMALEAQQAAAEKMSGKSGGAAAPAQNAAQPAAAAPASTPAPTPQSGFQVGKPYLDAQKRQRIFRGYAQDGSPLFSQ